MYRFIAAWYNQQGPWYDRVSETSSGQMLSEFDDTVSQLHMFQQAGEAVEVLVMNYQPFLRSFLHRQDLAQISYWSAFDQLQGLVDQHCLPIHYADLSWPADAQFLYMPFHIAVMAHGVLYARVYLTQMGYLLGVDYFRAGDRISYHEYDDRGFLSRIRYYHEGELVRDDYLSQSGKVVMTHHHQEDQSVILYAEPEYSHLQSEYPSMEALLVALYRSYVDTQMQATDPIVMASHYAHNQWVVKSLQGHPLALSHFHKRNPPGQLDMTAVEWPYLSFIVTDTEAAKQVLEHDWARMKRPLCPCYAVTPYDTRLELGKSQRLEALILLVKVDGLKVGQLEALVQELMRSTEQYPSLRIKLISDLTGAYNQAMLEDLVHSVQVDQQTQLLTEVKDFADKQAKVKEDIPLLELKILHSEADLMKAMEYARLVLDLGAEADLYTQIAAVSTGIPQLVRRESAYVKHLENGYLVNQPTELYEALDYFLGGLKHWNEALVYSVDKINTYYSGRLVHLWKQLLKEPVHESYSN